MEEIDPVVATVANATESIQAHARTDEWPEALAVACGLKELLVKRVAQHDAFRAARVMDDAIERLRANLVEKIREAKLPF